MKIVFLCILIFANLNNFLFSSIPLDKTGTYKGPKIQAQKIEIIYTENALIKAKITAPVAQTFKNNDMIFPKTIFVEFYDKEKKVKAILESKYVRYDSKNNLYYMKQYVKITNKKSGDTLSSTELTWNPEKKKVYGDQSVEIETKDVKLKGTGIMAEQDMSSYTIPNTKGIIRINKKKKVENQDPKDQLEVKKSETEKSNKNQIPLQTT